ncbi:MAG: hypothetical protein RJA07_771 [Bacteroidota bacterium]
MKNILILLFLFLPFMSFGQDSKDSTFRFHIVSFAFGTKQFNGDELNPILNKAGFGSFPTSVPITLCYSPEIYNKKYLGNLNLEWSKKEKDFNDGKSIIINNFQCSIVGGYNLLKAESKSNFHWFITMGGWISVYQIKLYQFHADTSSLNNYISSSNFDIKQIKTIPIGVSFGTKLIYDWRLPIMFLRGFSLSIGYSYMPIDGTWYHEFGKFKEAPKGSIDGWYLKAHINIF